MPELPEVETIKRQLARKVIGKKLRNRKITNVRRRAKLLIIDFSDNSSLIFHLKLTGQLIFNGKPSSSTRKVFYFEDGSHLTFNDARKFGWWKKVKGTKRAEEGFGPEALEVDFKSLKTLFKKRSNTKIKPLLMDQKSIAGIGNIYSNEILFAARIHPLRQVKTLSEKEAWQIFHNVKKILKKAIQYRGTTEQYYRDACGQEGDYLKLLKVYGREGKKCSRCGAAIKREKIGGRSAYFCPKCQPL
ncbi:hypothetical protein AMJ48_02240 [Parcubacteria bacterium DG_74_1]|nr:MAG: hypothetical protein AMJ48_02240 [Parcubacteria bacterium DG_74_1]